MEPPSASYTTTTKMVALSLTFLSNGSPQVDPERARKWAWSTHKWAWPENFARILLHWDPSLCNPRSATEAQKVAIGVTISLRIWPMILLSDEKTTHSMHVPKIILQDVA